MPFLTWTRSCNGRSGAKEPPAAAASPTLAVNPMYSRSLLVALALTLSGLDGVAGGATLRIADVDDARVMGQKSGDNWPVKGGGFSQQQFSQLKDINTGNVSRLGLTWSMRYPD